MRGIIKQAIDKARRFTSGRAAFRPGTAGRLQTNPAAKSPRSFAAVAIEPGIGACKHVGVYTGRKMLEKNAPSLPLAGCDNAECRCRYRKFADRRGAGDRRLPFADRQLLNFMSDNIVERQKADRRARQKSTRPRAYFNNYD